MSTKTVVAIDIGAESGRVTAVEFNGTSFTLKELHRFSNPVNEAGGHLRWDMSHLWKNIQVGIARSKSFNPLSIGVDTWAVDFALLDNDGNLLESPVMYRDNRTDGMMDVVFETIPKHEVFAKTGIQFLQINTLYQLMSLKRCSPNLLNQASTLLMIPDLINYWLTGSKVCEFTNATTTQMFNPLTGTWAYEMLKQLGLPSHILPRIVQPGTQLGNYDGIPVIAPATHDTASAVVACPMMNNRSAYISSGTWSLVGLEVTSAVISDMSLNSNLTNEGGINGTYRLLKNVMGLWLLQQCRLAWAKEEYEYSYDELVHMAMQATNHLHTFDVDDTRFLTIGHHPDRILAWFRERGIQGPKNHAEMIYCILNSLAWRYKAVLDDLQTIAGQSIETIHIIGGGSQNTLLNQLTANRTGKQVIAGPVEATILGNAIVQFQALDIIDSIQQARTIVSEMGITSTIQPQFSH